MAKGAAYALSPQPNYIHCTDPEDATQLTDGQVTEGHFWTQQGTVGWRGAKYVTITVDLGRIEPIAGASFRTAAGAANVAWPVAIRIHVSEDGESFYDAGDLLELDSNARDLPGEYAVRTFATQTLQCKGRYVRFMVTPAGPYIFTDEVEVLRGDDSFLDLEPTGQPVADLDEIYLGYKITAGVRRRFNADLVGLERSIRDSDLDPSVKEPLLGRVEELRPKLEDRIPSRPLAGFRTILPFNEVHAELFRIQAKLWSASGHPAVSAWAAGCHWDPLDLFAAPQAAGEAIEVHTMLGEHRSGAFNVSNATDSPVQVSFRVEGISGGSTPSWLTSYAVPWTDTVTGQAVAAALVEIAPEDGRWTVEVQPGLTQQVWLTFHVTDLPPGRHEGHVVITAPGVGDVNVPLSVNVYPLTFPTATTLWLGGWSYTDGQGRYGITPANRSPLINHLRDRFVNAPWATAGVMMKFSFRDGQPELDTSAFDEWIAQWPQARAYLVFLSVGRKFAGTESGTPEFNQRVGRWISAWVQHLAGKGINADQLGVLLVDEPRKPEHDETIIAWAEAIHAAESDVLIWQDPVYRDPKEGNPRMYEVSDILCPNRPMWLAVGKPFEDFYREQQRQGRTLQLYSCSGPARLLDPYSYYRLQAWHCWQIGATGSFFWAFGDNNRASSWIEYAATTGPYTPLFLDDTSVVPAKQMEAIRESVEDYEYFVMLKRAVRRASGGDTGPAAAQARDLLRHAADQVLGSQDPAGLRWHVPKDRTQADAVRVHLLEALTELTPAAD